MPETEQLRIEYVPLSELRHWPRNPKSHDIGALSESLKRFGFVSPILWDENSQQIVAGHGRVDTLTFLKGSGAEPPHRIVARGDDWLVPIIRGIRFVSDGEAEAYLVADNQLTMLGGWNDAGLYEALKRQLDDGSLEGTGFDEEDVDELRRRLQSTPYGAQEPDEPDEPISFLLYDKDTVAGHAFSFFRARGFPYKELPLHTQMLELNRLAMCDQEKALRTHLGYSVADTYHRHRFECHAVDKRSPVDSFHDDAQLRRAIGLVLDNGGMIGDGMFSTLTLVAGTQACSNFRPGMAMHFYRRFGEPNGTVLDPCTGYGGRLIGWIASRLGGKYIGVDPSTQTHEANTRMAALLAPPDSVQLINLPFEDVDLDVLGLTGQVDLVFTSPPYFNKERYADEETQSFKRYLTFDGWREGFLTALLSGAFAALKPGKYCGINIADIKVRNRVFPLEEATREVAAKVGFDLIETIELVFSHHFGQGLDDVDEPKTEPLFIFRKPENAPVPEPRRPATVKKAKKKKG